MTATEVQTESTASVAVPVDPAVDARRRMVGLAAVVLAAFLIASFVLSEAPAETSTLTVTFQRVLASLLGTGGVLGAVRAFSSPGLSLVRRAARVALALIGHRSGLVAVPRPGRRPRRHPQRHPRARAQRQHLRARQPLARPVAAGLGALHRPLGHGARRAARCGARRERRAMGLFLGTAGAGGSTAACCSSPVVAVLGGVYGLVLGGTSGRIRLLVGVGGRCGAGRARRRVPADRVPAPRSSPSRWSD